MLKKQRKPRVRIYSYKPGSRSAKTLSLNLGGKVLKHGPDSLYKPRAGDLVINWGSSDFPAFAPASTLNAEVSDCSNKLVSFQRLSEGGVNVPDFWTDKEDIPDDAFPVVCRTKLRGHSGDGIVIAETRDDLVNAPLYTRYVKKKHEYRVHVFTSPIPEAFFIQRKAKKHGVENPNWKVRNLEGGFVFAETDYNDTPVEVIEQSYKAAEALGIDFGGVDVIWNEYEGKAYVLEINTACGLEERTADRYGEKFRDYFEGAR